MGFAGLLHWLFGLERGQVEQVVEHLLGLGQVLGVGEGVGLEVEGKLCGVDVDVVWLRELKTQICFC
jgi:hypothetical protein